MTSQRKKGTVTKFLLASLFIGLTAYGAKNSCNKISASPKIQLKIYEGVSENGVACRVLLFSEDKKINKGVFWYGPHVLGTFQLEASNAHAQILTGFSGANRKKLVVDISTDETAINALSFKNEKALTNIEVGQMLLVDIKP